MLNGLDLFSGIGGISLALSPWVRTIAYCEQDSYCQSVLLSRMSDGQIATAPIWPDVATLLPEMLPRNEIDIICGGFPCQDLSVAGNGEGLEGERSGLFFEIIRLTRDIRPNFVFLENVPAITVRGLDRVLLEFTKIGYDTRWTIVSAAEIGAPHLRERWFLLAHANNDRKWAQQISECRRENKTEPRNNGKKEYVANAVSKGCERSDRQKQKQQSHTKYCRKEWWETEPNVGRVVNGLPFRMDRIKALGNAVVPAQVSEAFERLMGLSKIKADK